MRRSALPVSQSILGLILAVACVRPNTKVDLAQIPVEHFSPQLAQAQTRVVPLPYAKVFPRALDVLLDMGFQVRCASQDAGLANISRTWRDTSGSTLSVEATLLFRAEGSGSTRIRMSATGNWKFISVGGPKSADSDVSGISSVEDPAGYASFLNRLVAGIAPKG